MLTPGSLEDALGSSSSSSTSSSFSNFVPQLQATSQRDSEVVQALSLPGRICVLQRWVHLGHHADRRPFSRGESMSTSREILMKYENSNTSNRTAFHLHDMAMHLLVKLSTGLNFQAFPQAAVTQITIFAEKVPPLPDNAFLHFTEHLL